MFLKRHSAEIKTGSFAHEDEFEGRKVLKNTQLFYLDRLKMC